MKNCKISHLSKEVVLKLLCMSTPNFSTNFVILHTLSAKVVYQDFFCLHFCATISFRCKNDNVKMQLFLLDVKKKSFSHYQSCIANKLLLLYCCSRADSSTPWPFMDPHLWTPIQFLAIFDCWDVLTNYFKNH